jgi:hypothetical protein
MMTVWLALDIEERVVLWEIISAVARWIVVSVLLAMKKVKEEGKKCCIAVMETEDNKLMVVRSEVKNVFRREVVG